MLGILFDFCGLGLLPERIRSGTISIIGQGLWCVFELAAYRKVNPTGKIVIEPVLNEATACQLFFWVTLFTFVFWFSRIGPNGADTPRVLFVFLAIFAVVFPSLTHVGRKSQLDSQKLESDLAQFDVTTVQCSNEFDKECIHNAIIHWYGSLAAFSEHVRGPFRFEVLELMRASGSMSLNYLFLSLTPIFCVSLEGFLALCRAGAPINSQLGYALSHMLAHDLLWLPSTVSLGW